MTASPRLADLAQASPRSQRRRTPADAAADSPTSKKTPRATRISRKTTGLKGNGVEDGKTLDTSGERHVIEPDLTEEISPSLPEGPSPEKTTKRRKVKQELEEDTWVQEPQGEDTSKKTKRKHKVEEDQKSENSQLDPAAPKTVKRKRVVKAEEAETETGDPSPKKAKRKKATEAEIDETVEDEVAPHKSSRKTKVKEEDEEAQEGEAGQKKAKRKRKTKEEREVEAMPLAVRTDGLRMFIGAHVSGAKGGSLSTYIAPVKLRPTLLRI